MQSWGWRLTRVTTDPEVTACVHAEVSIGEVALHAVLEVEDVVVVGEKFV